MKEHFAQPDAIGQLTEILLSGAGSLDRQHYYHWDEMRRRPPPDGLSLDEWWAITKFSRAHGRRPLPLLDPGGRAFSYLVADPVQERLHRVDQHLGGQVEFANDPETIASPQARDRYLVSSLIEEAVTSSQLEGAATTREHARDMIRSGRRPVNQSERMILNNYLAMRRLDEFKQQPLTPAVVCELHRTITEDTLPADALAPYFRTPGDGVGVYDVRDNALLHEPPPAGEIPSRMAAMCDFANDTGQTGFLHPVLRAVALHFWLAYDHPFIDGNGRTARALFYWSMLSQGYWLVEFISISALLRKAPVQYARSFQYVETDENDLTYFLVAQLDVVGRAVDMLRRHLAKKRAEMQAVDRLLQASVALNHRQRALLSHALRHPRTRYLIAAHKRSHQVTYQTARTDLLGLEKLGLLEKVRAGNTFVFLAAPEVEARLRSLGSSP